MSGACDSSAKTDLIQSTASGNQNIQYLMGVFFLVLFGRYSIAYAMVDPDLYGRRGSVGQLGQPSWLLL